MFLNLITLKQLNFRYGCLIISKRDQIVAISYFSLLLISIIIQLLKFILKDRYATDETLPQIDESQDWILLDSKQNSTHTIIKFSRPYTTCDKEFDRQITRDTTRLIYAYSDSDPKSITNLKIHGRHERGSKSVLLLSYTESFQNEPKETDLKSFTLNVENVSTFYEL